MSSKPMAYASEVFIEYGSEELRDMYSSVRVEIVRITPELAAAWLANNTRNRPINRQHVARFVSTFLARDMVLNGETIIFSSDGVLLNGQHRLTACVRSGIDFDSVVVHGISPSAFDTIDGVKTRSTSDVLSMENIPDATRVAAAVQCLVSFVDRGGVLRESSGGGGTRKATPRLTARVLAVHPGIIDSVRVMSHNSIMRNQHGFALHYLFGMSNKDLANDFACVLAEGSDDKHRPFNVFREQLIKQPWRTDLRGPYSAKAIKAFNAEFTGERPKILRVSETEDFPEICGLDYESFAESIA